MTSNYFDYITDFDKIVDNDPIKVSWGDYWNLKTHEYNSYTWNNCVFSCEEIERIKTIGKRLNKERASTGGAGVNCLDHRRSFVSWIPMNDLTAWIYQKLTALIEENNEKYYNFDLTQIERLQFTYYDSKEEGCYFSHVDPLEWKNPYNRKLSLVVQLSDPSEYEGGELRLYQSSSPTIIRKEKGLVITFPSYTLHEVTPVTKGERYSLVAWVHGPAFK